MRKHVEHYEGSGQIETEKLARENVRYVLDVWQEMLSAASHDYPDATIPGIASISGFFVCADPSRHLALGMMSSGTNILHLKDGKKLRVFFAEVNEHTVRVEGSGGFF